MDDTAGNAGEHTPAQPQEPADEGVGAPRPEPAEAHPSGPAPPDIGLAAPGDPDEATGSVTTLGQPATTSRMEGEDHAAPVLAGISRPEADDGAQAGPDRDKPETCPRTERVEAHEPFQEYLEGRVRKPSDSDAAAEAGQVDNDAGQELPQDSIAGAQGPALSAELADEPGLVKLGADAGDPNSDSVVVAPVVGVKAATLRAAPDAGAPVRPIEEGRGQLPAVLKPAVQELGEVPADQEAPTPALRVDVELPRPPPATDPGAQGSQLATRLPVLVRPEAGTLVRRPPYEAARAPLIYLRRALWASGVAAAGLAMTVLVLVVAYRWINPPLSALMLGQSLAGTPIERSWVPITRISPTLIRAVVLSEDAGFCHHHGVDWAALHEAIESDRGGSTITMQVVKNLFLWPSRSYVRKAIEIGLAYLVEAVWPKRRILEIYLNIAEWGEGVFGAEAAANAHFDKRASSLTAEEAALLAVALPNPLERTPAAPSLATGRLAARLLARMAAARVDLSCLAGPQKAHLFPARD